jgi:hypothetical protein
LGVGEVLGVLQQRPPGALELLGDALVGVAAGRLPDLAADAVQGVPGELNDVKRIMPTSA